MKKLLYYNFTTYFNNDVVYKNQTTLASLSLQYYYYFFFILNIKYTYSIIYFLRGDVNANLVVKMFWAWSCSLCTYTYGIVNRFLYYRLQTFFFLTLNGRDIKLSKSTKLRDNDIYILYIYIYFYCDRSNRW